jgi:hypothetical protein
MRSLAATCLAFIASACAETDTASKVALLEVRPVDEVFRMVESLWPVQSDTVLVANISSIDVDSSGALLIADYSEGDIKHYARNGDLLRVVGRKGRGPGELMTPFFPRFRSDGIVVADVRMHPDLTVFDHYGAFVRRLPLGGISSIHGLELLANGNFLIAGFAADHADNHVLFQVSSEGQIIRRYLDIRGVRPRESKRTSWDNFLSFGIGVHGDTAYVTASVSDTLWIVDLETGRTLRERILVQGVDFPPDPTTRDLAAPAAMIHWSKRYHWAQAPLRIDSLLLVPFVKGDVSDQASVTAVRSFSNTWTAIAPGPWFMRANSRELVALVTEGDSLQFNFYRARDR